MIETSISRDQEVRNPEPRKTERPPRQHVVTPEERKQRALLAKAFLDRYGRDDDLDMHHSCLERLGG